MSELIEQKSLLSIVNEAMTLEKMLIESNGEITPEIEQALAVNQQELSLKADGYHTIMERFDNLERHYLARADFYKRIASQCGGVVDRLKNNIKLAIHEMGVTEIKGEDIRFVIKETKGKVIIEDEEMLSVS